MIAEIAKVSTKHRTLMASPDGQNINCVKMADSSPLLSVAIAERDINNDVLLAW